ncbi:MAG: hypothetical protein ACPGVT_05590 [Maricaulaceae bacterium]
MNPFSHFRGLKLRGRTIHVAQTGAAIKIDGALAKSALAIAVLNTYITAMRLSRTLRGKAATGTIAFKPQNPGPWYNIRLMAHFAGLKITRDTAKADHIFIFDDSTHSMAGGALSETERAKAINHNITDISKINVARIFEDVFGYPLHIDPLSYSGHAVQKSDANGTHDGIIVDCPLPADQIKDGCAYQKLIDSTFNDRQSEDLRAAICFDEIPVIFHKYKDLSKRFGTDYAKVDVIEAQDVFSTLERTRIKTFCKTIGLDFGAIDIMRDKSDGRIYIVDVNKTCMPVLSLKLSEQAKAFRTIAKAFMTK